MFTLLVSCKRREATRRETDGKTGRKKMLKERKQRMKTKDDCVKGRSTGRFVIPRDISQSNQRQA